MMYDKLIRQLRNCAIESAPCKACDMVNDDSCTDGLMKQAADSIEELSTVVRVQKAVLEKFPRWIPVAERLPEAESKSFWVCTDTGYQCECRWTNNRFGIRELDEWGWCLFDIPPYQNVVAWMPLPCPYEPAEEVET